MKSLQLIDETNVVSLSAGSLGGKGRGLAFINTLIYSFELGRLIPGINIKTPVTAIIGTDEFDLFMERNHLWNLVKEEKDFDLIQKAFMESSLSYTLEKKLRIFLKEDHQTSCCKVIKSFRRFNESAIFRDFRNISSAE